ncbi:hypothetical protein [Nocardia seriolae]|nr:hypothetical protein [Nocardia seriolae]MTJ65812.1 hypothetical protein [Nocardia seriolae]
MIGGTGMRLSRIIGAVAGAVVVGLSVPAVSEAYPNLYEGLEIGGCGSYDAVGKVGAPVACDSVAAQYRLIEQYQLTADTQDQRCGPHATLRYHHRTDEGFRLALYCFTYNMTIGSCWDLTNVNDPHRLDCAAGSPASERITDMIDGVTTENPCPKKAIVYPRLDMTVCVAPN